MLICRVDDATSETMTELAAFDLPRADVRRLQPQTARDDLERTTHTTGNAILRRLFQAQSEQIDAQLTEQHRLAFPAAVIHADGPEPITVASRLALTDVGTHTLADASTTYEAEMASVLDATLSADEQQHLHTLIRRLLIAADNGEAV